MANFRPRHPVIHGDPPLPPQTRVRCRVSGMPGEVQPYTHSVGQFPVRWDNPGTGAIWETCLAGDLIIIGTGRF
jgi:hypothetical protein